MSCTVRNRWSVSLPQSVQREMDQMFEHFFGNTPGDQRTAQVVAPASLWEEEGRWCLEFDLPGVNLEDIDITLEKNTLRLTAERKAPPADRTFRHQERGYGQIQRQITLPETVDPEQIEAELRDGVLRIALTKRPEVLPKKVQVKAS